MKVDEKKDLLVDILLYILKRAGSPLGIHSLSKIMYFAEKEHLAKYALPLSGDDFIAMDYGPVPSFTYDILKSLRGEGRLVSAKQEFEKSFSLIDKNTVRALREPDMENLSQSEKECLDRSIYENKDLTFGELVDKSHDVAWREASLNTDVISSTTMCKDAGADESIIELLQLHTENDKITFAKP